MIKLDIGEWASHVKNILFNTGFGYVWNTQSVENDQLFVNRFEQRCKDIHIQQCFADIERSNRCRMYREIKTTYGTETYLNCTLSKQLRIFFTKCRLSSHKFLVERGRWDKPPIVYHERKCTLCNSGDIEDEYHVAMKCTYFKDIRVKYIKPYYYVRPSMQKFVNLMNTTNNRDRHKLMIFIKLIFQSYKDTL